MGLEERSLEQYDRVLEVIEAALLAPAPPHPDPTGNKLEIVCKKPAQTSLGVETLRRSTSPKTLPRAVLRPAREKETLHPAPVVSSTISADRWESKMRVLRRMARTAGMKFLRANDAWDNGPRYALPIAFSIADSAASALEPSGPPACAMSGRPPPPLPPSASDATRTRSTALKRDVRSLVTPTTTPALPSSETLTMATTPEPTRFFPSSARLLRSFISRPLTS